MYSSCSNYKTFQPSGLGSLESAVASSYEISSYTSFASSRHPHQLSYITTTAAYKTAASPDYRAEQQPLIFLNPDRPRTPFIAEAAEISCLIKEAFAKTTQKELPESITITVAARELLQQAHKQFLSAAVVGLSISSSREVFAVAGSLDEVMLTIGHELGHVITPLLPDQHAEEAKAFAFEMAWAQAISLHDIGGLRNSISQSAIAMKPASNGLHDLAFEFVRAAMLLEGKEPLELHSQLAEQRTFENEFENFAAVAAADTATTPVSYAPLSSACRLSYHSSGYRNRSNVQNVPWMQNFTWADLGTGIYGMYIPLTASIFMNERLLRSDLEQFHKTLGHEYVLHHVMQLPDGYVAKIMEEQIFWTKDEKDNYKP